MVIPVSRVRSARAIDVFPAPEGEDSTSISPCLVIITPSSCAKSVLLLVWDLRFLCIMFLYCLTFQYERPVFLQNYDLELQKRNNPSLDALLHQRLITWVSYRRFRQPFDAVCVPFVSWLNLIL